MRQFRTAVFAVILALSAAVVWMPGSSVLQAQATTQQTTLSAAVSATARTVQVASATNLAAGWTMVLSGREAVTIGSTYTVGSTTVPVNRGASNTGVFAHASGAVVLAGPAGYFAKSEPQGPCTATSQVALPLVVIGGVGGPPTTVSILNCQGASTTTGVWQLYTRNGFAMSTGWTTNTPAGVAPPTYTTAGAITLMPGLQFIGSSGALAMTLANPALYQSGTVMTLYASTAQAHTITYTAGFFGTTTSSDVCTLGGAIGDYLQVVAQNATWRAVSSRNCTIA